MTESSFDKRIKKIEVDTAEIKRQIMRLEFQHKKDVVTARKAAEARDKAADARNKEADARNKEADARNKEADARSENIDKQIQHLSRLMGITYEELDNLDTKVREAGRVLTRPRKASSLA